jgi:hypothetical protein
MSNSESQFCKIIQDILAKTGRKGDSIRYTQGVINILQRKYWYERLVAIALRSMADTERKITITREYLLQEYRHSVDWGALFHLIAKAVELNNSNVRNYDDEKQREYNEDINYFLVYSMSRMPTKTGAIFNDDDYYYDFDPNNFLWSLYTKLLLGPDGFKYYKLYLPTNMKNSAKIEIQRCGPLALTIPDELLKFQTLPGFRNFKSCLSNRRLRVLVDAKYCGRHYKDCNAKNVEGYGCHKFMSLGKITCPNYYEVRKVIAANPQLCKKYVCIIRCKNFGDEAVYLQTAEVKPKKGKSYQKRILETLPCYDDASITSAIKNQEDWMKKTQAALDEDTYSKAKMKTMMERVPKADRSKFLLYGAKADYPN